MNTWRQGTEGASQLIQSFCGVNSLHQPQHCTQPKLTLGKARALCSWKPWASFPGEVWRWTEVSCLGKKALGKTKNSGWNSKCSRFSSNKLPVRFSKHISKESDYTKQCDFSVEKTPWYWTWMTSGTLMARTAGPDFKEGKHRRILLCSLIL